MLRTGLVAGLMAALLAACTNNGGGGDKVVVYDGISEFETIRLLGNEPFWAIEIAGDQLTYTSPDNMDGTTTSVTRFSGNGGLGFSGVLDDASLQIAVTPGNCEDGMSDRTYPFTATVRVGDRDFVGCGYSDQHPFDGPENP